MLSLGRDALIDKDGRQMATKPEFCPWDPHTLRRSLTLAPYILL